MLLLSKLQAPLPKPETLKRPRLLELLANNLDRKLLVITGDAGYGKTTLLAQVREKAKLPSVFLSLEQGDGDLVTFFSLLVWGLERLQPGLAKRCQGLVKRGTDIGKNHQLAMGTLLNELVEKRNEELFIFLDDYHAIEDQSLVHQALDYFIDHLSAAVHVVIASRKEPPLPSLAKWRAKRDLVELSREALKFTGEEIKDLLGQFYRLSISETELDGILQKTEGWITGVQLILQAAGRDGKTVRETLDAYLDEHGDLFSYFAQEIFIREEPGLRDFMKRSSVLEAMTPDACRDILKIKNAEKLLKELAQSNLFVTMNGAGEYKYHRLFREFLYEQFSHQEEKKELLTRAAEYFSRQGEPEKAIDHYLSAERFREAVELIGRERERMINWSQFTLLQSWLDRFPENIFEDFPWLYAVRAVLCKEQGKLEQAEAYYQQAEKLMPGKGKKETSRAYVLYEKGIVLHRKGESKEALDALKQAAESCPAVDRILKTTILGYTSQVWVEGLGDIQKARSYLDQARRLLKETDDKLQLAYIEQKRAVLLESAGEKRQAFKIYKKIIEQIDSNYFHLVGSYFHNAAKIALDLGQTDWAEECLNKGQSLCRGYEDVFSRSMLEFGFGYLYLFKGQWDQARQHLEKARDIFREMNWTRSLCISLRQLSRLCRYRGDHENAEKYINQMKQLAPGPIDQTAGLMEQGMIEAARGQYGNAKEILDSCSPQAVKYFGKMGEIVCCLTEANIQAGFKKQAEALNRFRKAVELSREAGFDGMLACELRANPVLRELAKKCKPEGAYLLSLLPFQPVSEKAQAKEAETCLRVELLGPPKIFWGGKEVYTGLRRQAIHLLCLLAYHGERGLSRDEILEKMWPRVKLKQAVDNFHLVLFEVRQGLQKAIGKSQGKAIVKEGGRYRIIRSLAVKVDAHIFESALAEAGEAERNGDTSAARNILKKALKLKQGGFCSGWTEDWALELSQRFEDLHQKTVLKLGAVHFRDGELENSRECYDSAIKRDELCEEAYRGVIRIHGAQGNLNEAKATFTKLEKALRKELKAEPAPETMELYRTVMAQKK